MSDSEMVFLNEGGILVTKTRFVSGSQTFPMASIASVRGVETSPNLIAHWILILFGGFIAFIGIGCLVDSSEELPLWGGWIIILIGTCCVAVGVVALRRQKPNFVVMLTTAGGELSAYSSPDADFMVRVINALNEAIIARG
jgi:hypothetical protein